MAIDPKPTPTPPDPQADTLIPVRSVVFPVGFKLKLPGLAMGRSLPEGKTKPSTGEYWSIVYDRKLRHLIVAHFKPGADLKRAPTDTLCIPEHMAAWRRA